jgi:5-methylcytosine-specific restriction endonuclease McrA
VSDLPDPLTPPDCDLRGMPFMPLDVVRIGDSDLFALSTGDEFKAAVSLWCKSWLQVPAASLPDDQRILAHLSGAGSRWAKVAPMALRGWVKCSDGRLYHAVVAEKAREAWKHREAQRLRVLNRWRDRTPPEDAPVANSGEKSGTVRAERMKAARAKGTHTPREWAALVEVCGAKCLRCDAVGRLEKDHIIPVYAGGSDAIDNLQPLCPSCNCRKGPDQRDLRPDDWHARMTDVMHTTVSPRNNHGSTARIQGTGTVKKEEEEEERPSLRDGAEAAPVDARTDLFRTGLADVRRITGMTEGRARALIGKCLKAAGDDATAVARAIARCADARPADPVPWLLAACDAQQFRNGFLAVIAADRWGEDGPEPEEARNPFLIGSAHGTH